jgi:hypothetical protein
MDVDPLMLSLVRITVIALATLGLAMIYYAVNTPPME